LILGGAVLQRCDNWLVSSTGFSRCGQTAAQKIFFPQPVKPLVWRVLTAWLKPCPFKAIRETT
jgi:hypothetical protein